MSDLDEAIAEVKRVTPADQPWTIFDFWPNPDDTEISPTYGHLATILNAVASGDLIHKAEIERGLSDPTAVHYSMLCGTIAKPSVAQIVHLYPDLIPHADALAMVAAAKADAMESAARIAETTNTGLMNDGFFFGGKVAKNIRIARAALQGGQT